MRLLGCAFESDDDHIKSLIEALGELPHEARKAALAIEQDYPNFLWTAISCIRELEQKGLRAESLFYTEGNVFAVTMRVYGSTTSRKYKLERVKQ